MGEPPLQVEADACLLIFDVHEDLAWLRSILGRERGNFDHVLLGGDYFDARGCPPDGGVVPLCEALIELRGEFGSRLTVLLGNHDISYLEVLPAIGRRHQLGMTGYTTSGFSWSTAERVAELLGPTWWKDCRLFALVNGFLVSHAGLAAAFWPDRPTFAESLAALQEQAEKALREWDAPHPLLGAGVSRGGVQPAGGITWLDFNEEFRDELPLPQIFGHTPSVAGARRRGRSWCLDGRQTCYGLLRRDGSLEIKTPPRPG